MSDHSSLHLLIGGEKLSGGSRETQDVIDPATAEVLGSLPHASAEDLDTALEIMTRHDTFEATRQDALSWADKARQALAPLPKGELRDLLADLADFVVARLN